MQTIKSTTFSIASALVLTVFAPVLTGAEDKTLGTDNSWVGVVTSDTALVRCGPNESYYPTVTAKTGDLVLVNGKSQDWLKIDTVGALFEGVVGYVKYSSDNISTCLVTGTIGNITNDVEVLAKNIDSDELYRSWRPVLRLHDGDTAWILNTETTKPGTLHREAYVVHTIKMPKGGSGWINTSFVKQATEEQVALFYGAGADSVFVENTPAGVVEQADEVIIANADVAEEVPEKLIPLSLVELEAAWEKIAAESAMLAEVSPLKDLYSELLNNSGDDLVVVQVAGGRIKQLDVWEGLQAQRGRIERLRSDLGKQADDVSEFQTIMAMNEEYAIVGKLALSNTFDGRLRPLMYRIQDQASGRTVGYLPANKDFELSGLVGQHVGVVGNSTWNPTWRVRVVEGTRFDILSPTTAIVTPDIQ